MSKDGDPIDDRIKYFIESEVDADRIAGCRCDPDAPSWIGIEPNGRVLAFSQSKYEIVKENK